MNSKTDWPKVIATIAVCVTAGVIGVLAEAPVVGGLIVLIGLGSVWG